MKEAPLDLLNRTFASALGHIHDSLITYRTSERNNTETEWPSQPFLLTFFGSNIIILSTLLLIGLAVGSGALVWAGRFLKRHHDEGREVSVIILSLLLTDLLELLVIPIEVTSLLNVLACYRGLNCLAAMMTFGFARQCGYCFHQLVALEGILAFRQPDGATRLSTPRYAIPVSLFVWIWALVTLIMGTSTPLVSFLMGEVIGTGTIVLACIHSILTCMRCSHPDRKPGNMVNAVALFTLVFLYGPFIVWLSMLLNGILLLDLGFISIGIITFRLVTDPVLCVLVCKNKSHSTVSDVWISHTLNDKA